MQGLAIYIAKLLTEAAVSDVLSANLDQPTNKVESIIPTIEAKLQELVNSELEICLAIVKAQEKSWGECVVMPKTLCADIAMKIKERIKQ